MSDELPRRLFCASHGRQRWTGQVICINCDAVWHLNVHNPPTEDGRCTCGAELIGDKGKARAICSTCYEERRAGPS